MVTITTDREYPAPQIDPTTTSFWDAAREGKLMLGFCKDTGKHFFYPRGSSPFTLSPNVELVQSTGRGTIYSFSVARSKQPFAIAYVELAEGPRIVSNIVDCDLDALKIGQAVQLVWKPTEGGGPPLPMFSPC